MALGYMGTLAALFDEADTPDALRHWLLSTLGIRHVSELVDYVHKDQYKEEWRSLVRGAFPVTTDQAKQEEIPAAGNTPVTAGNPAAQLLPEDKQQMLVSRMWATYKVALSRQQEQVEDNQAAGSSTQTPRGHKRTANSQSVQGTHTWQVSGKRANRDQNHNLICGPFNGREDAGSPARWAIAMCVTLWPLTARLVKGAMDSPTTAHPSVRWEAADISLSPCFRKERAWA